MKQQIVHLDLFSGTGGFALGLKQAGFEVSKHYFSEVDKHAIANYRYNFKDAQYVGSVTDVRGGELERPNIITFGSPCQDFSLAGKRAGLGGERSSLIHHAIRLITECRPDVFIWENVKGAFSSNNGADFWAIIQAFANIGGYRLEWQLLNTAWVLPQNRERIYLVGHLGNRGGRNVFPFGENDQLFNQRQTGAKSETKLCTAITVGESKIRKENTFIEVPKKAGCLSAGGHSGGLHSDMTILKVKSATAQGYETATNGDSINLSQPNSETRRGRVGKAKAQTLETSCNQAVIQINPSTESGGKQPYQQNRVYAKEGLSPAIDQAAGKWGVNTTRIRRLTEIECERLQGFPDTWTKYGINDKGETVEISRTQRYKLCGNAVTATIVKLIGQRLHQGLEFQKEGK